MLGGVVVELTSLRRQLSRGSRGAVSKSSLTGLVVQLQETLVGEMSSYRNKHTLVAWGLNRWGECGVSSLKPVLPVPEEVSGVSGENVSQIHAGSSHSIVLENEGNVFTFGKGSSGELGSGKLDPVFTAARVEHLVGSHRIVSAAAGPLCSFYLNDEGNVLASGKLISARDAAMWNEALSAHSMVFDNESSETDMLLLGGGQDESSISGTLNQLSQFSGGRQHHGRYQQQHGRHQQQRRVPAAVAQQDQGTLSSMHFVPFIDHRSRSIETQMSKYLYSEPLRNMTNIYSASKLWDDHMSGESSWTDSVSLPTVLGGGAGLMGSIVGGGGLRNILNRCSIKDVVSCSVSGTSLALDATGAPVLIEPLKVALHAFDKSELPASWAQSSYPCDMVLQAVQDDGGGVKAAVGEDFSCVLTAHGTVVVWWRTSTNPSRGENRDAVSTMRKQGHHNLYSQGNTSMMILKSPSDSPITDIAASPDCIVLTDGACAVWRVSMMAHGASNSEYRSSMVSSVDQMKEEMKVSEFGNFSVKKVVAGARSTAVITDSGKLFLWGNIVSPAELEKASRAAEAEGFGHWSYSDTTGAPVHRRWAGLGGHTTPTQVPGLHGVADIALGPTHALAVVV